MKDFLGSVGCILIASSPFVIASGAVAASPELKDYLAKTGAMMAVGGACVTAMAHACKHEDEGNE